MGYDYQLPASQAPDLYGAFLRGQLGSQQLQANQQGLQEGQLNMQQLQQTMRMQQQRAALANQLYGQGQGGQQPQQGTQAAGAQDTGGAPTGGIQQGPQGMPPQGQAPQQPGMPQGGALDDWLATRKQIQANTQLGQYDAIIKGGDPNVALKNGYEAQDAALKDQQNRAKIALTPYVTTIDETLSSPNPGAIVNNNQNLRQLYAQNAPKYGIDPRDPLQMTPQNLRTVLTGVHNDIAAKSFGAIAPKDMPNPLQDVRGPDGAILQRDPTTNKLSEVVGRQPAATMMMGDTSALEGQAKAIAEYRQAPFSGTSARSPQAAQVMKLVYQMNPQYDATNFEAKKKAYDQFTSGKTGNTVRSLSVATSHLDQLQGLVGALNNGDTQAFNKIGNAFAEQTGSTAPTNFNAAKKIVADEVVKAIVGSGGGVSDREEASKSISSAQSPQQLLGVIQTYKGLMGGQLEGLQRQYEKSTGRKDFQDFVSSEAQQQLEGKKSSSAPSAGDVVKGYKFKGGNPADKNNWEKAGG